MIVLLKYPMWDKGFDMDKLKKDNLIKKIDIPYQHAYGLASSVQLSKP